MSTRKVLNESDCDYSIKTYVGFGKKIKDVPSGWALNLLDIRDFIPVLRYEFEGYEIAYTSRNEAGKGSRCFSITTPDGRAITYRGDEVLGNDDNDAAATSLIYLGEGKALFTTGDYVLKYYEINLETGQVTQAANDYSWIADDLYNATYVKGTGYVICDMEGLKKIDFKNKKKEEK